jgi:hypothetical protein
MKQVPGTRSLLSAPCGTFGATILGVSSQDRPPSAQPTVQIKPNQINGCRHQSEERNKYKLADSCEIQCCIKSGRKGSSSHSVQGDSCVRNKALNREENGIETCVNLSSRRVLSIGALAVKVPRESSGARRSAASRSSAVMVPAHTDHCSVNISSFVRSSGPSPDLCEKPSVKPSTAAVSSSATRVQGGGWMPGRLVPK